MNDRYQDEIGRPLLIDALQMQAIVCNDFGIAESIAQQSELQSFASGDVLIHQNDSDAVLHFILDGEVDIIVNGRSVAKRRAGEQVGEMALVEPARRSATVVACTTTVTAVINESGFRALAKQHPAVWRNMARVFAKRLREREGLLRSPRQLPRLFIGSSSETYPVVEAFCAGLMAFTDKVEVTTWRDPDVFLVSRTFIENLITAVQDADFGLLIMGPDDRVESRSTSCMAPRDNVIFELGLFIGTLGRDRTAMAVPSGIDLKIPSDLLGMVPTNYTLGENKMQGPIDVTSAVDVIERLVRRLGAR